MFSLLRLICPIYELVPKLCNKGTYQKEGTRTYPESAEDTLVPTFYRQVPLRFER